MLKPPLLVSVGAFMLAIAWWFLRIEAPIKSTALGFPNYDLYSYYYPTVRFAFDEVRHGHLPLWNPYQAAGEPFFANQQHGLLYPFNMLHLLLPSQAAFKWSAIVHMSAALVFAAYLGRTIGLSTGPTLLAALTFTFGVLPPLIYVRTWLNGAIWLPLEIALAIRLFRDGGKGWMVLALAAAFACQYVGGYPMYNLLGGYAIGFYAFWQSVVLGRRGQWRAALRGNAALAAAALLACMLSAIQLLPMIQMTGLSPRRFGSLATAGTDLFGSANLRNVATLFIPGLQSRSVGAAAVPLVLYSAVHPRLRAPAAFFATLALLAAALAAGPATPLYRLYQQMPTSNWFRFPGEFVCLAALGWAFAIGIGAEALTLRTAGLRRVSWAVPAVLVLLAGAVRIDPLASVLSSAGKVTATTLIAITVLLLLAAGHSRRLHWAAVLCIVSADLMFGFANSSVIPDVDPDRFEAGPALLRFLRDHQGLQRTYLHAPPFQLPLAKAGMVHRLFTVADHESLIPLRYAEYAAWAENGSTPSSTFPPQGGLFLDRHRKHMKLLDLLGVRFVVAFGDSPFATAAEAVQYPQVFVGDGATVYENPRAVPRAFVVGHADAVDAKTVLARMSSVTFDPLAVALVETGAAAVTGGVSRPAVIDSYLPERVMIHANGDAPGLLILTDQFYPGWDATVDGKPAPIYCADYIFRAVSLPPGDHSVVFTYRPRPLVVGLCITTLTLVAMIGWAVWAYVSGRSARGRLTHLPR